jgi:hypothetical protein
MLLCGGSLPCRYCLALFRVNFVIVAPSISGCDETSFALLKVSRIPVLSGFQSSACLADIAP